MLFRYAVNGINKEREREGDVMMVYGDFYDIAIFGNANWKGGFTPKEIAENAYEYLCAFKESVECGIPTHTIQNLLELLDEDGSETALEYANMIRNELKLNIAEK